MTTDTTVLVLIIGVALAFDFMNGFHDAANSIATIVSTRVLSPRAAVVWAAFFNMVAFLIFGLHVASTIATGVVDPHVIDRYVVVAALVGALFWDIVTWYFGIPSSSSHALIGGLGGAAIAKAGFGSLEMAGFLKIGASIVLSPLLGLVLGYLLMTFVSFAMFRETPRAVDRHFRKLQFVSAALYSLGHGGNDAQKTMGIIAALLFSAGKLGPTFHVPLWVVLACHAAMALGTMFGGWRIVKTMGMKITKLRPVGGFCAEASGAITLFAATALGVPVSTTHTITGSIMGVGAVNRLSAVRWGVAERIVIAWILTLPAAAAVSYVTWRIIGLFL